MSLTLATYLAAAILLAIGIPFLVGGSKTAALVRGNLRNAILTNVVFGIAAIWFLYEVATMSEADFPTFKNAFLIGFAAISIGSAIYVRDFLLVRGGAAVVLLASNEMLKAAFLQEPGTRLFLVTVVYIAILKALYLAAVPYKLRDILEWLEKKPLYLTIAGGACSAYGILLAIVAATY